MESRTLAGRVQEILGGQTGRLLEPDIDAPTSGSVGDTLDAYPSISGTFRCSEDVSTLLARRLFSRPSPTPRWDTQRIKDALLQYKGVGEKTVSCMLLFNLGRAEFPVDVHVWRITREAPLRSGHSALRETNREMTVNSTKRFLNCTETL